MDIMNFPQTVDEFMEQYKIVDREEVYTNGAEMVPIFRMKQWFEHEALKKAPTFEWLMQKADEWGMVYGKQFLIEAQRAWEEGKDTNVPSKSALDHIHSVVKDDAYKRGYEQGKADAAPKWIPVTPETLPEEGHDVLITKEPLKIKGYEHEVIRAKRSADPRSGKIEWWSPEFGALADKTVLAWMEKPEPWKGE